MPTPRKHQTPADRQAAWRARQAEARERERTAKGLPATAPIPTMPSTARWSALCRLAMDSLVTARDEMDAYADERSEAWQESERADTFRERIEALEAVIGDLEELL